MVKKDDDEIAKNVLEGIGIIPEKQEIREQQNIYQASELGNLERVRQLIATNGEEFASVADAEGYYGIHWAALGGHLEVIRYYESINIPLSLPTKNDVMYAPIHWSASRGHLHVVEYLLERGIDIDTPDNKGVTPLISTAQFGQPLAMAWLLHKGANPHACDKQGDNALHWSSYKGNFDCFTLLLRQGLDATQLDAYQQNCLHLAVIGHNLTLIDKCLELGCSLGQKDQVGNTPMKLAEGRKYYDVIRWFQEYLPRHQQPFLLRTGIKPGPTRNAHVAFLILFLNLFLFGYPTYLLYLLPNSLEFYGTHCILVATQFIMWFSYFMCRTVHPGYVPANDPEYEETMNKITNFKLQHEGPFGPNNRLKNPFSELCHSCKTIRPPRAKHCRVCQRCVLVFDHHCPYIYTCIGYRNRVYFASFIITGFLTCFLGLYMTYMRWDLVTGPLLWIGFVDLFGSSIGTTLLFIQTVRAAIRNVTVNESVNWSKYDHFKAGNGVFVNPFHRGVLRNLLEFCYVVRPAELPYTKRTVLNRKQNDLV